MMWHPSIGGDVFRVINASFRIHLISLPFLPLYLHTELPIHYDVGADQVKLLQVFFSCCFNFSCFFLLNMEKSCPI